MRRIIVGAQVSMDGVMQAPGGPTEDPTKGFKFGGWAMPYFDQEFGEEIDRVFKEEFDLLGADDNLPHGSLSFVLLNGRTAVSVPDNLALGNINVLPSGAGGQA